MDDYTMILAAMTAGVLRWEPFVGKIKEGELCFNGLRYATKLNIEGCPMLPTILRAELIRAGY